MSNEEFQKKADFIVDQQAHFAARIGQLEDLVTQFARATRDRFEVTDKRIEVTDKRIEDMDEKIAALINSQMQTEESQRKTEESLRNLVAVVDRYFTERRNGS